MKFSVNLWDQVKECTVMIQNFHYNVETFYNRKQYTVVICFPEQWLNTKQVFSELYLFSDEITTNTESITANILLMKVSDCLFLKCSIHLINNLWDNKGHRYMCLLLLDCIFSGESLGKMISRCNTKEKYTAFPISSNKSPGFSCIPWASFFS